MAGSVHVLPILVVSVVAWTAYFRCWRGRLVPQPAAGARYGRASGDAPGVLVAACPECGARRDARGALRDFRRARSLAVLVGLVAS